jgi:DNA-binding transcriptional regulator YbjK
VLSVGITRREQVLDAAITVLGTQGVRGVTHRAVDAEAGVPAGTTSNHFRTRDALFEGVVERFVLRERAVFEELAKGAAPRTPLELTAVLADWTVAAVGPQRELTIARFAILVEAAIRPSLRRKLAEAAAEVSAWATELMRAAGSVDPERDVRYLANQVEAMTLHQLAYPDPDFDPGPALAALVTAVVPASTTVRAGAGGRPGGGA